MKTRDNLLISIQRPNEFTTDLRNRWYSRINAGNHKNIREEFFSLTSPKLIYSYQIEQEYNGMHTEYYIHDYERDTHTFLAKDIALLTHGTRNSFLTMRVPDGVKHRVLILDSNFNVAPNLSGVDPYFDVHLRLDAHVSGDYIHFMQGGNSFIMDGEYNIVFKFPGKLDYDRSDYIDENTKEFPIIDNGSISIYDIERHETTCKGIKRFTCVGGMAEFLDDGTIYRYDRHIGHFIMMSGRDDLLIGVPHTECPDLASFHGYGQPCDLDNDDMHLISDETRVFKTDEGYHVMHGTRFINRDRAFTSVQPILNGNYVDYLCSIGNVQDILMSDGKFKFGVFEKLTGQGKNGNWLEK